MTGFPCSVLYAATLALVVAGTGTAAIAADLQAGAQARTAPAASARTLVKKTPPLPVYRVAMPAYRDAIRLASRFSGYFPLVLGVTY